MSFNVLRTHKKCKKKSSKQTFGVFLDRAILPAIRRKKGPMSNFGGHFYVLKKSLQEKKLKGIFFHAQKKRFGTSRRNITV